MLHRKKNTVKTTRVRSRQTKTETRGKTNAYKMISCSWMRTWSQVKCSSGKDEQRSQDLLGTSGAGLAKDLPSTMCCGNILCEIIAARAETRRLQLAEQAEQDTRRQGYS